MLFRMMEGLPKKIVIFAAAVVFMGASALAGWHIRVDVKQDGQIAELTKNLVTLTEAVRQNEQARKETREEMKEWREEMLSQIKENRSVLSRLSRSLDRDAVR